MVRDRDGFRRNGITSMVTPAEAYAQHEHPRLQYDEMNLATDVFDTIDVCFTARLIFVFFTITDFIISRWLQ